MESAPNLRLTADGAHYSVFIPAIREICGFPPSTSSTSHRIRNELSSFMNKFVEIGLIQFDLSTHPFPRKRLMP